MTHEQEIQIGDNIFFESFLPYIHSNSLDRKIQSDFLIYLKLLHTETMNEWIPGRCKEFTKYESCAVQILSSLPELSQHYQITRHKFRLWHQWFNLESDQQETLIIDPTGIPLNFENNPQTLIIVPHFGLINNAHRYAQEVYNFA